jgi:hypothetical protein
MIDITAPEAVELMISCDGKVIWVNIDGECQLRVCQIKYLDVNDYRKIMSGTAVKEYIE